MQVNNKSAYDTAISGKFNNNYLNSYITGSLKQGNLDNTLIEIRHYIIFSLLSNIWLTNKITYTIASITYY